MLDEQPRLLSGVRDKSIDAEVIAQRQRELILALSSEEIARVAADPELARVAMLDLSFAMNGLIFSKRTPPTEVQQLNGHLAEITGLPKMMTFEKIVIVNSKLPFGQMRTFTDGEQRDTERRFYYGHDLIDTLLQDTTDVAVQSIDILRTREKHGVAEAAELLARGASNTRGFAEFMRNFLRMPREHFSTFRQYLSQYPDGNRNASGAFIGMPRLQIRLAGLTPRYEEFLDEGMRYFPIHEQSDIQQARVMAQQGCYLVAQCERLQPGEPQLTIANTLKSVIEPIRDFRLSHLAAVVKYVPEAMPEGVKDLKTQLAQTGEEPIFDESSIVARGTAGFIPGPLLRNVLRMDIRALERLDAIIGKGQTK